MCVINKPLFHHLTNISKHTQALCFFALFAPKSDIKLSPVFPVFSEALCSVCRPVHVMCCMHKGLSLLLLEWTWTIPRAPWATLQIRINGRQEERRQPQTNGEENHRGEWAESYILMSSGIWAECQNLEMFGNLFLNAQKLDLCVRLPMTKTEVSTSLQTQQTTL